MKRILKWPWVIIAIIAVITVFFAFQLPNLKINNAVKIFLPEEHPSKLANERMEEIYGSSDVIAIAIESKRGNLITEENISQIKEISDDFETMRNIKEVTSLTNADYIEGTSEGMTVEELVKNLPENEKELLKIKEKLLSWDMYRGNLYSEDLKSTQISLKLKSGLAIETKEKVYNQITKKLDSYQNQQLDFYLAGSPAINVLMGENMESDLKRLVPIVIAVVLLALFLAFKNFGGVILPMLTVFISTIWALGIMALLEIRLTMVSTVIPVLLVAVGSAYGIHIISHYYDELKEENNCDLSEERHRELVVNTVKKVGKPVLLAGLTTIVGFSSLGASNIVPIKEFGIFTAIGVFTAVIVAITLIPAILLVRHSSLSCKDNDGAEESRLNSILLSLYHYFAKAKIRILALALVIVIISGFGMSKIKIDSIMVEMFKDDTQIRQADKFINDNFNGTNILNVMIDGSEEGSMTDPEVLKEMEGLQNYLTDKYDQVGQVTSVANFIKRMNQVLHYPEENQKSSFDSEEKSKTTGENTNSFGEETTSNFGEEEDTSDFESEENTSNFGGDETTSDFGGEENTSDFGTDNSESGQESESTLGDSPAPSHQELSESELVGLLNKAVVKADKLNLTGEELIDAVSRELNYKGAAYQEIPYNLDKYPATNQKELKNLISQYLLMYSGSLDDLIDQQLEPTQGRMMVQMKTASNIMTNKIENDIKSYVDQYFPEGYQVSMAGNADMALSVNNLIVSSQIMSIIISLIVVFLIVAINYRSLLAGIYGIIPLSISLLINFGIMGYAGIKLDIGTAMVASIAIGIGVDYTVHFLSAYSHEREKSDDLEEVCQNTLLTAGKAIIFNAASVAAGFAVLLFSNFYPLVNLGLLVTITMLTSSLAAMTILPALLNLFKPKFINNK
ncbi:MAG: efflux RND transporter permease subunit [Bacillota bacterium]